MLGMWQNDGGSSFYGLSPSRTTSFGTRFRQQKQILQDFAFTRDL
jgi:hypothetical protein